MTRGYFNALFWAPGNAYSRHFGASIESSKSWIFTWGKLYNNETQTPELVSVYDWNTAYFRLDNLLVNLRINVQLMDSGTNVINNEWAISSRECGVFAIIQSDSSCNIKCLCKTARKFKTSFDLCRWYISNTDFNGNAKDNDQWLQCEKSNDWYAMPDEATTLSTYLELNNPTSSNSWRKNCILSSNFVDRDLPRYCFNRCRQMLLLDADCFLLLCCVCCWEVNRQSSIEEKWRVSIVGDVHEWRADIWQNYD